MYLWEPKLDLNFSNSAALQGEATIDATDSCAQLSIMWAGICMLVNLRSVLLLLLRFPLVTRHPFSLIKSEGLWETLKLTIEFEKEKKHNFHF